MKSTRSFPVMQTRPVEVLVIIREERAEERKEKLWKSGQTSRATENKTLAKSGLHEK